MLTRLGGSHLSSESRWKTLLGLANFSKLRSIEQDCFRVTCRPLAGFDSAAANPLRRVRSNERGEIGFLADTRRTNVALTLAKLKLILVGDSATPARNPFYAGYDQLLRNQRCLSFGLVIHGVEILDDE